MAQYFDFLKIPTEGPVSMATYLLGMYSLFGN